MISRIKLIAIFAALGLGSAPVFAQRPTAPQEAAKEEKLAPAPKDSKNFTADQLAEAVIVIYSGGGGRDRLNQIRKTAIESGRTVITNPEGGTQTGTYRRFVLRADSMDKDRIRLDQTFPNVTYALVLNDAQVFMRVGESVYAPREDVSQAFQNQINHGLEALLRYKENGSKIELAGRDKLMGVEYHLLDVTDKQNRKTRFFVSSKTFRVMMLDYEKDGVKYRRKFYDYNYAQGTLVPFQTVLWAGDKIVEETEVGTITFGQKVDEGLFAGAS